MGKNSSQKMKLHILDKTGKKIREKETKLFEEPVRVDLIRKVVEAERAWQPYSVKLYSGMNRSASGQVRHKRHSWKSDRGRGMARIPKKQMWRRGTQFSWVGAIVPFARGGRRAHPPHGQINDKKINKKELRKALLSSLRYISSVEEIQKKYHSLKNKKLQIQLPIIVEANTLTGKTKEFLHILGNILGDIAVIALKKKQLRAGKGKSRGRKYKTSGGVLFVVGNNEHKPMQGIDIVPANELRVSDLAGNGARLTIFTEKAIDDIEKRLLHTETKLKEKK
jgi:large subunit ribosomal protein L4e